MATLSRYSTSLHIISAEPSKIKVVTMVSVLQFPGAYLVVYHVPFLSMFILIKIGFCSDAYIMQITYWLQSCTPQIFLMKSTLQTQQNMDNL